MTDFRRSSLFIVLLLLIVSAGYAADWCGTVSVRGGRCDPECDIESPYKSLFMFGGSFEMWYKDLISIGPYMYYSQLHSGPLGASVYSGSWNYPEYANFRTYIAGLDLKARVRPKWDPINIRFPGHFIDRIAPYVDGGVGVITFDPQDREGYLIDGWEYDADADTLIPHDYERHAGVFPVWGGGLTFFSRLGVTADLGIEYHQVNSDFLDGVKDNDDKDGFWTGYIGVTLINTCKPPAPKVIIPEEPVIEIEPEPEAKFTPRLDVTPPVQNVPFQAGTTNFAVDSNTSWIVSEAEDWLSVSPLSGSNNGTLVVAYDANNSEYERTGKITVSGSGISRNVTIVQAPPRMLVTPSIQNVSYPAGTTSFTVDSNIDWTVVESEDWLSVSPLSGSNNGTLVVNYDANPKPIVRVGQITVRGAGITRTVNVVQAEKKIEFVKERSLIIEGVNFHVDKADLTDGAKLILDEVVKTLNEFPEVTLDIQGHTDSDASDAYNMDLSRRRSISVKNYLTEHGIAASRLTTSWYGERKPIDTNETDAGKARNRRIEFVRTD